jgi:hypothetical protein
MQNGKKDKEHSFGLILFVSVFLLPERDKIKAEGVRTTTIPKEAKQSAQTGQPSEKRKGENYQQMNRSKPLDGRDDLLLSPQEKKKQRHCWTIF